jgi:hypothetical protein
MPTRSTSARARTGIRADCLAGRKSVSLGLLELDLERRAARRRDVDRAAGVMLAEPRRRRHREDRLERIAARELGTDDLGLALDAAERRCERDRHAVCGGGGLQRAPGGSGRRDQQKFAPLFADLGDLELSRFVVFAQAARGEPVGGNLQLFNQRCAARIHEARMIA